MNLEVGTFNPRGPSVYSLRFFLLEKRGSGLTIHCHVFRLSSGARANLSPKPRIGLRSLILLRCHFPPRGAIARIRAFPIGT